MSKRLYNLSLVICLILFGSSACAAHVTRYNVAEKAWLDSHQVLRVGVVESAPPILYYAGGSLPKGLVADYLHALALHLGLQLELRRFADEPSLANALANAEIDLVGAAVGGLDRDKPWLYTRPYLSLPSALFGQDDLSINGVSELRGKTVAVVRGSVWDKGLLMLFPDVKVIRFASMEDGLKAVANGRAFAFLGDVATTEYLLQQTEIGDIEERFRTLLAYDISVASAQDVPELQSLIQKGLERISDEELKSIWLRWPDVERPDYIESSFSIWILVLPLLIAWTVFVGWMVRRFTKQQQVHRHGRLKATIHRLYRREKDLKRKMVRLKRKALKYRAELRKHRQQLGLLGDVMPNTAWVWDSTADQCQWDEGMYGLFQADEESFAPTPEAILDRVHMDDRDRVSALFSAEDVNNEVHLSYRVVLPDGRVKWILDYSHGSTEEGAVQRVGICWDISGFQLDDVIGELEKSTG